MSGKRTRRDPLAGFFAELEQRGMIARLLFALEEQRAAGREGEAAVADALRKVLGKPPARSAAKRRFVADLLEQGVPPFALERYFAKPKSR